MEERDELEARLKVVKDLIRGENSRIDAFIKASLDSFNSFYNVSSKRKYANVSVDDGQRKEIVVTEKHIVPTDVIVCGIGDLKSNSSNQQNNQHNKPKHS
jgi:hypothetical protein